jgi:hypothetical protein
MADTRGTEFLSIRGKRRSVSVKRLKEKARRGRFSSTDRALVRVGHGTTKVLIGMDDLSEWDEEELTRGRRRDKNGHFNGRDPVVIPKAVHDEVVKRTLKNAQSILRENLTAAVQMLTLLSTDPQVEPKDRLKAIEMIMTRVMGKEPVTVRVEGEAKWQVALQGAIMSMKTFEDVAIGDGERDEDNDDDDIIDAEVVSDA